MSSNDDTIVVFTARSPERIVRERGSQAWVLDESRAGRCTYLVCAQNQHNPNRAFRDATRPHAEGFLVGKISEISPAEEPGDEHRWHIGISEFALISVPGLWQGWRNPVRYTSINDLGIDLEELDWETIGPDPNSAETLGGKLTIAEAKQGLALMFGVAPEDVEITIRG